MMVKRVTKEFIKIEKTGRTIATRDSKTAQLTGRKLTRAP